MQSSTMRKTRPRTTWWLHKPWVAKNNTDGSGQEAYGNKVLRSGPKANWGPTEWSWAPVPWLGLKVPTITPKHAWKHAESVSWDHIQETVCLSLFKQAVSLSATDLRPPAVVGAHKTLLWLSSGKWGAPHTHTIFLPLTYCNSLKKDIYIVKTFSFCWTLIMHSLYAYSSATYVGRVIQCLNEGRV